MNRIINSEITLKIVLGEIDREFRKKKYLSVKIVSSKRSIIQNSLQFHWYRELEQQGDQTSNEYRRYCKYHFGLAIRASIDEDFATIMRDTLSRHTYENRLLMMDYIDVTSTFNREQMISYLTEIKNHFIPKMFVLTTAEDL